MHFYKFIFSCTAYDSMWGGIYFCGFSVRSLLHDCRMISHDVQLVILSRQFLLYNFCRRYGTLSFSYIFKIVSVIAFIFGRTIGDNI
jgi:hypothetical protein